jgi:choice-of-anchor B domain-containing protein
VALVHLFVVGLAYAHSDFDKALFVAPTGSDTGQCNNRFRPCKTIAYAVIQASKGDKILVAQGSYTIESSEAIVYLVSNIFPIYGGYNLTDNYQNQSPSQFTTTLIGIPTQYADALYSNGFHIISDTKSIEQEAMQVNRSTSANQHTEQKISKGLNAIALMQTAQPASACVDGNAAGFACQKMSLLGRLPLNQLPTGSNSANDIWGHVDLNDMREYAIIGLRQGLAVVDVTLPETPVVVGSVSGQSTTWRDIKVLQYYDKNTKRFKAYAYSGADNVTERLTVIDLSNLPNSIDFVRRSQTDRESHNVYISHVNYTTNTALSEETNGQFTPLTPMLHITGSSEFGGAWRTYTLDEPANPQAAYTKTDALRSDYTHDATSFVTSDARATNNCGLSAGSSCNVIIDFNESQVRLWQHNNAQQATQLSQFTYPNADYVHSGWWSEDKQYIFVHDELDERRFALNTTINVFDISDLSAPLLVATWRGPTKATDHNGFVKGNKYYMSNYERGVTVLDISDPTAPNEIAFFDTFGASNNASFSGAWGVYPFLPSGNILASDIQGGLYILKDDTLMPSDDAVGFSKTQLSGEEGTTLRVEVVKQGAGAMSVDYEFLLPSAQNEDINIASGTLDWLANDSQSQFVDIDIVSDSEEEFDELVVLVLNNPKNGDLINSQSHAFITIEGTAVNSGSLSFEQANLDVLETHEQLSLRVSRLIGSEGSVNANIIVSSGTAERDVDFTIDNQIDALSLFWGDGDASDRLITINIIDDTIQESNETFSLSIQSDNALMLNDIDELTINIKDDDSNTAPSVDAGPQIQVNTRQTVFLNSAVVTDNQGELVYKWSQVSGPTISIGNSDQLVASFVAPSVASTIVLTLSVSDEFGVTSADNLNIDVVAPSVSAPNPASSSSGGGGLGILSLCGLSVLLFMRNFYTVPKKLDSA